MEDLDYLRKQIDEIDDEMVKLFLKRMEVVCSVADYKRKNGMEVLVRSREEQVIERHISNIEDETQKCEVKEFLESLMYLSRKAQKEMLSEKIAAAEKADEKLQGKVGYSGVEGSFSHEALLEYFGEDIEAKGYLTFKNVFEALKNDEIRYGVLPIENSSTGSITEVYDLLGKYSFYIVGEQCIHVEHNLLGIKDTKLSDINEVYSKDQGFLQCTEFFESYPRWKLIPYVNTAKSAEYISQENSKNKACVASKKAARVYGLDIIKENINNIKNNNTRFVVVGKSMQVNEKCNKISVAVTLPHKVGSLYSVLKHFAENNSNMVKIESRPIADKPWEYVFYIDFNGNLLEKNTNNTLESIERESLYFKLLGNYISEVRCD